MGGILKGGQPFDFTAFKVQKAEIGQTDNIKALCEFRMLV